MGSPPLKSTNNKDFFVEKRPIRTAGLAGIVCGANVRPRLLEGGGSCKEAETQIVRNGNHRRSTTVRMSRALNGNKKLTHKGMEF